MWTNELFRIRIGEWPTTVCRSLIFGGSLNQRGLGEYKSLGVAVVLPLVLSLSFSLRYLSLSLRLSSLFLPLPPMDSSSLDHGLHHQPVPHPDQSASYGIPSSFSNLLVDEFPPPPVDPLAVFWHHHPSLPLPPQSDQMAVTFPCHPPPPYIYDIQDDSTPPGAREKRHW